MSPEAAATELNAILKTITPVRCVVVPTAAFRSRVLNFSVASDWGGAGLSTSD
jgi:hypothetical protein